MKLHEKTRLWWERVLEAALEFEWLKRLHQAELEGSDRFRDIIRKWRPQHTADWTTILTIAIEEQGHALLVDAALLKRGYDAPRKYPAGRERYWDAVYEGITDFPQACAVAAYGEVLALNRFRVLVAHPQTPPDIYRLAAEILPEEEEHARVLRGLAGKTAMDAMRPFHRRGMAALGLADVDDDD